MGVRPQLEHEVARVYCCALALGKISQDFLDILNKSATETCHTTSKSNDKVGDKGESPTPWLIFKMVCFWRSDMLFLSSWSMEKWYAAGKRTAPTERLSSDEWIWVAAANVEIV